MKYLLDADICVFAMRRKAGVARRLLQETGSSGFNTAISVVVAGELALGVQKAKNKALANYQLGMLLANIPVLELPPDAAYKYGELRSALESAGQIIGGNDLWIAAHALALNFTLVTNNEREFSRVPDLRIENWTKPE